jgi:antibiotic biosynthesis monooxygenase
VFAVIYHWRLHPGAEAQFVDGWERVTRAIHATCGSYGSRLHRADDGTWVAYARWPDAATRARCHHGEAEGERLMAGSVAEQLGATTLEVVSDLLAEPDGDPPPRS